MRKIYILLLCTLLPVLLQKANGQPYYFRHYQVENGLSNNAAICCLQDQKGFVWFGTKDGLNRFDGYTFKVFRNNPEDSGSIGSNFIHCLYEDATGNLWVGTEKGLYLYNATAESFSLLSPAFNGMITEINMDNQGQLWFTMNFTLFKYDITTKAYKLYAGPKYDEFSSLTILPNGSVWLSTSTGYLKKYNPSTDTFTRFDMFAHSSKTSSKWIERIYGTADGNILVGTSNQGAKYFDTKTNNYKDIITYNADNTELFIRNFLQTSKTEFWMASESGIFIYNTQTEKALNIKKNYNDPYAISDNAVYALCKDKEGGIWAGTYFGGVNYYPKQNSPFKKFFPKTGNNSLSGNVVREIHEDTKGNLWIGTEDAGLNKLDKATGLFTSYQPNGKKDGISYTNIHGLLVDDEKIWIGTFEHGLDVMNATTGKVIKHYAKGNDTGSLKSNFIYCIAKQQDGSIIIGTTIGAYRYNNQKDNFTPIPSMPINNWYSYLLEENDGTIWAATFGNGVRRYNPKTNTAYNYTYNAANKNSLRSDRVNSIFKDSQNNLWFATEGGLSKLNKENNSFKNYTTKNGLPTDYILSMLEDDKKNLWISTSKGLVCLNPATEKLKIYTSITGTLNDQFNFSSAYKDASGEMYFGSVKGLISFNPAAFQENTFIPPVYITGFQVFNKELDINHNGSPLKKAINYTSKITLTYNQSTISIDFAALSFTAPEMSEYAYMMEGLENNWTYLKRNRKAYFTDLKPGSYTFKIKASNNEGLWNETETKLLIEILPPWWFSKWAYITYFALAILLVYYAIRLYHNYTEEKNRRKFEKLEIAKEKEIFEAKIEFFTNVAHEIKTPLTLIKAPLEKVIKKSDNYPELTSNLKIMDRNTNRLIELTNQLLDFRQTEISGFSLSFAKANISELLEETFNSFKPLAEQKNLRYILQLPPQPLYAYVDMDAFNKILYNLFSNAVKYAQNQVFISLGNHRPNNQLFEIECKNDGFIIPAEMKDKIFEPFFRLKETDKQKGTGIGLAISKSLVQLHNGQLKLKATENGFNVFSLILPVNQDSEFTLASRLDNEK